MNHTFKTLEFNKIIENWEMLAYTENAKERIQNIQPNLNESQVRKELRETTQARLMIDNVGMPPMVSFVELKEILNIAEKGGCLTAEQLNQTAFLLTAVKRMKEYLNRCKALEISLAYYEVELDAMDEQREELQEKIRNNQVDDYASKYLSNLRQDIEKLDTKIKEKAEVILRKNKQYLAEQYITSRNGKLCLPVKKTFKSKINGSVIDKSASGSTFFMEPDAIKELQEEMYFLKIEEENEVRRILYELTGKVADSADLFHTNQRIVEKLDFIFAKGKLSLDMKANEADINTERKFSIVNGRHPFMEENNCVPLNMTIEKGIRGMIITGPNTGGKTVAIKTAGLFSLMVQCGLHIPMEAGTIPMHNQVLCDIGDGQDMTESLSTFSAHITNVLDILKKANHESLVIMDELGSGTDPTEGMGIAIAVLDELEQSGCLFLVTTHYPEVKTYAEEKEHVVNARMAFDRETLKPLYQLEMGISGESCALYIAKRLGMPAAMIKKANYAAYQTTEVPFLSDETEKTKKKKVWTPSIKKIEKKKEVQKKDIRAYQLGDSVMVYPEKKIGIVCNPADEKGNIQVLVKGKKIWMNQKRIKLNVPASELYPEDYDFSIIFDTVENRKNRHKMEKGHQDGLVVTMEAE